MVPNFGEKLSGTFRCYYKFGVHDMKILVLGCARLCSRSRLRKVTQLIKVVQRRGLRSRTRELTFSFFSACGGKLTWFLLYLSFCVSEFCFSCRHVVDFMAVQEESQVG